MIFFKLHIWMWIIFVRNIYKYICIFKYLLDSALNLMFLVYIWPKIVSSLIIWFWGWTFLTQWPQNDAHILQRLVRLVYALTCSENGLANTLSWQNEHWCRVFSWHNQEPTLGSLWGFGGNKRGGGKPKDCRVFP